MHSAALNTRVQIFFKAPIFDSSGYMPSGRISESYGNSMFNYFSNIHTVSTFYVLISHAEGFQFLHILANNYYFLFVFFFLLLLHLRLMEVPRLGVESELQLLLHHSHSNAGSEPHLQTVQQLVAMQVS